MANKNNKVYSKEIELDLFNSFVMIYTSKNPKKMYEFLDELYDFSLNDISEEYLLSCSGFATQISNTEGMYNIIVLNDNYDNSTLMHEMLHIICNITEHCGVPFNLENQEVLCYMLGHMTKQFFNKKWEDVGYG
jgi:predicted DNA-binding protein YlxM (UPF0122 family)